MNTKREELKEERESNRTIKETNDVITILLPILLMTLTSPSFGFCLILDTIKLTYVCVCVLRGKRSRKIEYHHRVRPATIGQSSCY